MMLKTIVENQDFGIEYGDGMMTDDPTIPSDQNRHAGRMSRQHEGFIARIGETRVNMGPVGNQSDLSPTPPFVAATRQNDAPTSCAQAPGQTRGNRRLAGTANGQTSDTHHRASESAPAGRGPAHEAAMNARTQTVESRSQPDDRGSG
jgi:hypothetical protein